jgi:phosphomevalonate kinase
MDRKIIIISGKQFSGKDTVAKILLELLPDFKRIGLGDAIKIEYGKIKNLTFDEIETNKSLYRADLIDLGNKGRAQNSDFWLKKVLEQDCNIIVPDIRVPHEVEVFKAQNAISIRVESDREQRAKRGTLVKEDDPTETLLDNITDWDYIIENNQGYSELKETTEKLCQTLKTQLKF